MKINFVGLFCEDIRHEVQGSISLVGVCGAGMDIAAAGLPIVFPKFCALLLIRGLRDNVRGLSGRVQVTQNDKEIYSSKIEVPVNSFPESLGNHQVEVRVPVEITPFVLEKNCNVNLTYFDKNEIIMNVVAMRFSVTVNSESELSTK